ncbi:uncharacterized protein LOC117652026 [Thrips palmi]|uniref:Uncharacterized protein LOC117652026 n=1 Tax=Thrips palmi TaxID=161013 RepID=A0A6P9A5N4_THRPL|nr:uncharacterized protein LOC117652026 [Thrips palmi]
MFSLGATIGSAAPRITVKKEFGMDSFGEPRPLLLAAVVKKELREDGFVEPSPLLLAAVKKELGLEPGPLLPSAPASEQQASRDSAPSEAQGLLHPHSLTEDLPGSETPRPSTAPFAGKRLRPHCWNVWTVVGVLFGCSEEVKTVVGVPQGCSGNVNVKTVIGVPQGCSGNVKTTVGVLQGCSGNVWTVVGVLQGCSGNVNFKTVIGVPKAAPGTSTSRPSSASPKAAPGTSRPPSASSKAAPGTSGPSLASSPAPKKSKPSSVSSPPAPKKSKASSVSSPPAPKKSKPSSASSSPAPKRSKQLSSASSSAASRTSKPSSASSSAAPGTSRPPSASSKAAPGTSRPPSASSKTAPGTSRPASAISVVAASTSRRTSAVPQYTVVGHGTSFRGWCLFSGCSESFSSWEAYLEHSKSKHDPFVCSVCGFSSHGKPHGVMDSTCSLCPARFTEMQLLRTHQKGFHRVVEASSPPGNLRVVGWCPSLYCEHPASSWEDHVSHQRTCHPLPRGSGDAMCDLCLQTGPASGLPYHVHAHHYEDTGCPLCSARIIGDLSQHMAQFHHVRRDGSVPAVLGWCMRSGCHSSFSCWEDFVQHFIHWHANVRDPALTCHLCLAPLKTASHAQQHMDAHFNPRAEHFTCSGCPARFLQRKFFIAHMKIFHRFVLTPCGRK